VPVYGYECPEGHYFDQYFNSMKAAAEHSKEYLCKCGALGVRSYEFQQISAHGDSRQKRDRLVDDRKVRQAKRVDAMVADGKLTQDQAWRMSDIGKKGASPYLTNPKKHKSTPKETETDVEYVAE
jgi:hypothetical protein